MQTKNLIPGTAEWHAHRANHRNASDAPAMLGCSPHTKRAELLRWLHTGTAPEVDLATQRRFDEGHRFEALARPIAEEIIGDDLAPVVGVLEGTNLSASFDGLTLMGDTAWEHKTLNNDLRAALPHGDAGDNDPALLPKHYRVQMEQQLLVSGARRVLFMASCWSGDQLDDARYCWYTSDAALRADIVAGWAQFEQDLAAYVPREAEQPKPTGRTPETLPALRIEVTGMVTASNLDAFKEHALAVFGGINTALQSDQDFADAERTVKWCEDVEERLKAAKQHALSQTESIDALFRAIDEIGAEARRVRLDLDKKVKAEKEHRKGEIVAGGVAALREHIVALNAGRARGLMPQIPADFGGAVRGLKSLASMEDKVATELSRAKIAANEAADKIERNLATINELAADFPALLPDRDQLVLKAPEDCRAAILSRIAVHKQAEAERQAREAAEKQRRDALNAATPASTAAPAPAASNVVPMPSSAPAAVAMPATLNLGAINTRLGFTMTADFIKRMGLEPAATEKAAKLYTEPQFQVLCDSLVAHIRTAAVQAQQQQAA